MSNRIGIGSCIRAAFKNIYIALICLVLDYGCIAYGSAAKSSLKKLEVVQAQALRICCDAFKMTPLTALQVELGEMLLHIRHKQLMMNYWTNLQGHSEDRHPTKKVLPRILAQGLLVLLLIYQP